MPDYDNLLKKTDARDVLREIKRLEYENDFYKFFEDSWRTFDPSPFNDGMPLQAIAEHLQAVQQGQIKRLIINVPPRCSKSSLVSVAFTSWTWAQRKLSPVSGPGVQFLHASYSQSLSLRDSVKTRRLIQSPWYQKYWGERFKLMSDQNTKTRFDNDKGGSRLSTSVGSTLTGEGGNIIVVDDPNAAQEAFSEATIETTIDWWDTALSTRLNDAASGAFIIVQQRLAEDDLTGHILSKDIGEWTHLMLPMRYEWKRHSITSIGWEDWRGLADNGESLIYAMPDGERVAVDLEAQTILDNEREGSLLWPERFPEQEVRQLEATLGPWGAAGQLQQTPRIKGGGIIKSEWWQPWDDPVYPPFDFVMASVDTAYTEKEENDPSAITIWGMFSEDSIAQASRRTPTNNNPYNINREVAKTAPKLMLIKAWEGRLEFNALVKHIAKMCKEYGVVKILIENKATGISVSQEMRRLYYGEDWSVELIDPKNQDKVARLYAVQGLFEDGIVYAPNRPWAEMVIVQCATFPKAKHDDLVDTVSQAVRYFRTTGMLRRPEEIRYEIEDEMRVFSFPPPLYPV